MFSTAGGATKPAVQDPDCRHAPGAVSKLRDKFEDACLERDEKASLALISKGLLVNEVDEDGNTPLSLAVQAPMPKVARRLVELGANVNAGTDYNTTVLTSAIAGGSTDIVELLLLHGADVNHLTKNGCSPLMVAAQRGHLKVAKLLIASGALPSQTGGDGANALFAAAANGHAEMIRLLADAGCAVDSRNSDGETPLQAASLRGSLASVQALVDSGADVNAAGKNRYGMTPLTIAAYRKAGNEKQDYAGILRYLISKGARLDAPDGTGNTAIMLAANAGATRNIRALVEGGVNVRTPEWDVVKAFLDAVRHGRHATVAAFLDLGLPPDSCRPDSKEGLTPLFYAVQVSRDEKMAKLLLDAGADPNATRRFSPVLSGFILGPPHEPRESEQSLLIAAVQADSPAIVRLLLAAGANAGFRDTAGKSALDWAREMKRTQIIDIFDVEPKSAERDPLERLIAARRLPVKDPASTPFDSDPAARKVYLEEYRAGYRSILAGVDVACHMGVKGPDFEAYQAGWRAGKEAARKDNPGKATEIGP